MSSVTTYKGVHDFCEDKDQLSIAWMDSHAPIVSMIIIWPFGMITGCSPSEKWGPLNGASVIHSRIVTQPGAKGGSILSVTIPCNDAKEDLRKSRIAS